MDTTFLENYLRRLRTGKVLVVPSGNGDSAILLARNGFEVTSYDQNKEAIAKLQQRSMAERVKITAEGKDLGLIILPLMSFDSIVLIGPKPESRLFSEISRGLTNGGTVLIEGPTVDEAIRIGVDKLDPKACYKSNEVLTLLKGLQILYYSEEVVDGRSLIRCLAKKPTNKDAIKYGFAEARDGEASHKSAAMIAAEKLFKKS